MTDVQASSSALYDCVPTCEPMTVDALVMRHGRGGLNLYRINYSEPAVGNETTNVRVFAPQGVGNG